MLSNHQIEVAIKFNMMYNGLDFTPFGDLRTAEGVVSVAEYQAKEGLTVDGIFGPKTKAHLDGEDLTPITSDTLIAGGVHYEVPFKVVDFTEEDSFSFYHSPSTWRPREEKPSLFVLHWDVCWTSGQCFQVLLNRGLSVHLMVDIDGVVYQGLDLADMAKHAGAANSRSVGVEINNPIFLNRNKGNRRSVVADTSKMNSAELWSHLDFTDEQKLVAAQLADVVCDIFGITKRYPAKRGVLNRAPTDMVVGHYHISSNKCDPGLTLWPALDDIGFSSIKR